MIHAHKTAANRWPIPGMENTVGLDGPYLQFLRSLDDDEIINHIRSFLQSYRDSEVIAPPAQSIQRATVIRSQDSNASTDPFDDGLDNLLQDLTDESPDFKTEYEAQLDPLRAKNTQDDPQSNASDQSSEEERYQPNEFGDYGSYFQKKRRKQQETDEEYVKWDRKRRMIQGEEQVNSEIFKNCSVHVNGHTEPLLAEIHRLIIIHGGTYIGYLINKHAATHIICDRLTPRKRIMFKNYRVVKAKWVVDCVQAGMLLPWEQYRLIDLVAYDQGRLPFGPSTKNISQENTPTEPTDGEGDDAEEADEKDEGGPAETDGVDSDEPDLLELQNDKEMEEASQESRQELITYLNDRPRVNEHSVMDAKNPEFLRHFFSNSRLHHLSSWKADLRRQFLRHIIKSKGFTEAKSDQGKQRVILHVDFDSFFVTASCLSHPELDITKQPIAVSHGGKTSDVASCNYVAREYGIRNGQWLGGAKKRCPKLIVLDYDFDTYEKCSKDFYNFLIESNLFDTVFPVLIDEVLLEATTFCSLDDTYEDKVRELSSLIREKVLELTKCQVSVGASYNVFLAKLALRKAKPNGQFQVFHEVDDFLSDIKVNDLPGVGHSHLEKLQEMMKISSTPSVRELKQFSLTKLINTLGEKTGEKLYNYARGIDSTSIAIDLTNKEAVLGRKSVSVDVNYGIRFDTVPQLDDFFMRLAKELYRRLISLGICGSHLTLKLAKRAAGAPVNPPKHLGMGHCEFLSRSSRLGVATNDWGVVGSELKSLYRMSGVPVVELRGIAVTMTRLEDVDTLSKSKQTRLPFYKSSDASVGSPTITTTEKRLISYDKEAAAKLGLDWEVIQELPPEIRKEIVDELDRRNISSYAAGENRRRPKSPSKSPAKKTKGNFAGKAYLQQLIPSQTGSPASYVRTVAVQKSPIKRKNTSKSPLPQKKKEPLLPENLDSFDMSVLEQLPLSVQDEIRRDIAYKKKVQNFDTTSMRDKMTKERNSKSKIVDDSWLKSKASMCFLPEFQGVRVSTREMESKVRGWIEMSLDQQGPHRDDVDLFVEYLHELLLQSDVIRCISMVQKIQSLLKRHQAMVNCRPNEFVQAGINEWNSILLGTIIPVVKRHCAGKNIIVDALK